MKNRINSVLFLTFLVFYACKPSAEIQENEPVTEEDNIQTEDSISSVIITDTVQKAHEVKEQKENLAKIEKKYGEQWGFCECVVANDSIDKAVKKLVDFETPQAEKLLDRFEYVSKKCQAFLGMDASRTPEERQKHEKKVKKCLKEAKNK